MTYRPSRRDVLRLGTVCFAGAFAPEPTRAAPAAKAKACILVFLDGGPSHIDLWDLKPDAPADVRGPFRPIGSSVPGVPVCEHLPLTARELHRFTQIRSVVHDDVIHDPAVYRMLTGRKHPINAGGLTVQPTDAPHLACLFARGDTTPAVLPKAIEIPETMKMEGRTLPGQNAGVFGAAFEPFRVALTADGQVVPPDFVPRPDLSPRRLEQRAALARQLGSSGAEASYRRQAVDLLSRPHIPAAFDLSREPDRLRDRYGRNRHGQGLLLARRLVEAGARFVTVYWGREKQDWADGQGLRFANNPWDTHRNHFPLVKDDLLPRADRGLSALVADLTGRGMLDDTLVVWMGDFGRTPRIDRKYASRDHWPHANTVLLAGAGVPAGLVYGRTDANAAYVTENPVTPADLVATILHKLGVAPGQLVCDLAGKAMALCEGDVIRGI